MPTHPGKSKGITLSINRDRLLGAPVPTEERNVSEDLPDPESQPIETDDEQVRLSEEDKDNQKLIDMGVAFPKGATRDDTPSIEGQVLRSEQEVRA